MRIAVTGASGFVGRQLIPLLRARGHEVVAIARRRARPDGPHAELVVADVGDAAALRAAIAGSDVVIHLAGINREVGSQTFERVHVEGTRNAVDAARATSARKFLLLSYLRARPNCGSPYHESKWQSERIVTESGLDYTILKAGVIFGPGDGMITNLWRGMRLAPLFPTVGLSPRMLRPVWVGDVASILCTGALDGALSRRTVAVVGPEELSLAQAVRRVATATNRFVRTVPIPVFLQRWIAWVGERVMPNPLISVAQVRMLAEGISDPLPGDELVPESLAPATRFDRETILRSTVGL